MKNLAALQASNRPRPSPTCYSCPDRGLVMADTSLRDKEPDRALVYVFPGSALPALTPPPRPCLLCGASWATATGSLCSSTSSSSLQRPPREPAPVCPSFKGQPLLSLLLPLYAEPSREASPGLLAPAPLQSSRLSFLLAALSASRPSQQQKLESALSLTQLLLLDAFFLS